MKTAHRNGASERELAALNASAEAALMRYADDWDDAAIDAALDCALLCESHSRGDGDAFESH